MQYVYFGSLVVQERHYDPRISTSYPQRSIGYTRGIDLSGSEDGAGGIGGLLARSEHTPNSYTHACYHADGIGNVTALINESQAVVARYLYDPFGNIVSSSGPLAEANRYRFSSKELHPNSGLVYYGYRFYEPSLQRWLNRDPIGVNGGVNLHRFVGNSPANLWDARGLESQWNSIWLEYSQVAYRFDYRSPSFVAPDPDPDRRPNYLVYNIAVGWGADPIMRQTYRVFGPGQRPLYTEQSAWASFLAQEEWRSLNAINIDSLHASLDGVGLVDPTGAADAANAVLYAANGDFGNALISAASLLPAGDLAKAARIGENVRRGKAFQDAVKDFVRIEKGKVFESEIIGGKAISDGFGSINGSAEGIVEIKDQLYVWNSRQFRIYAESMLPIHLIISPNTIGISGPLQNAIRESNGSIHVFDPNSKSLLPWKP